MIKRIVIGSGMAGALATAYLLGSLTLGIAGAAAPQAAPVPQATTSAVAAQATPQAEASADQADPAGQGDQQDPGYKGSISIPQDQAGQPDQNEQDEAKALAALAKITPDQAKTAALAQFPNATVSKVDLGNENGSLVYGVALTDASGKAQDVKVDAGNAKVLATEASGPEGQESAEANGAPEAAESGN